MTTVPAVTAPRTVRSVPDLVAVLRAADAQTVFGWVLPDDPAERPQLLADTYHARFPHRKVLVLVADPTGLTYGIVPVGGRPYGLTLAPPSGRAKRDFLAPGGAGRFQLRLHHLVTRLAEATDADALRAALADFRGADGTEPDDGRVPAVRVFPLAPAARIGARPADRETGATPLQNLLATFADGSCPWAQPRGRVRPPSRRKVERLVSHLLSLLLPGYHGPLPEADGFSAFVLRRASAVQQELVQLVRRAVGFEKAVNPRAARVPPARWNTAEKSAWAFLERLPDVRRTLNEDVRVAYENDPALPEGQHHQIPLAYPGLAVIAVYRAAHLLHVLGVPYLPRMMTELAHSRYGIDIHPGAMIGPGFFIDHGTGVVIGETCVIGAGVTLYQGVTLGTLNFPRTEDGELERGAKRHPTLEDGVVVYANASILGNIVVRRGTKVGANVSLRQDTDPESVVRMPLSLRELSISSPRLALEPRVATKADAHRPEVIAPDSGVPAQRMVDPETGLPEHLLRDEREHFGFEEYDPTSP